MNDRSNKPVNSPVIFTNEMNMHQQVSQAYYSKKNTSANDNKLKKKPEPIADDHSSTSNNELKLHTKKMVHEQDRFKKDEVAPPLMDCCRPLNPDRDGVFTYGEDPCHKIRAVKTDFEGNLLVVTSLSPNEDGVLFYGSDRNKEIKPVLLDKKGRVAIKARRIKANKDSILSYGQDKKGTIHPILLNEQGKIEVNHRHLSPWRDRVLIYGVDEKSIKRPVELDKQGRVKVDTVKFISLTQHVITTELWKPLPPFDVSQLKVYSIAVVNLTENEAEVQIQISPDGCNYFTDLPEEIVCPFGINVFVPKRFLQYVRVVVKATKPCKNTKLDIFLQAQK